MRFVPFLALALALVAAPEAHAQYVFGPLDQDAPVDVPEIRALAMGDAVTAVSAPETAFFSNPAHLASLDGFRLTVLGGQAALGGNAWDSYAFYRDDLGPAIEEGLDEIGETDRQRLLDLYADALDIGREQKTADATVEALAMQFGAGPVSVGVGLFATGRARAKLTDGGAGIPYLDVYSQADLVIPVNVAMDVPGTPLAVGASAAYVERRVTAKAEFVDAIDPDGEKAYLLGGNGIALSAGVVASDVGLQGLDLGMALSNVGGVGDLAFDRSWTISAPEGAVIADDLAEIAELEARFSQRESNPVLRMGAAYSLPLPAESSVAGVTLSADWISGSTSEFEQAPETGFRVGAQAHLAKVLSVRAGLAQGYPTAGVGLNLSFLQVDYATYGVEDGRTLGQLGRRNHVLQLRLGVF